MTTAGTGTLHYVAEPGHEDSIATLVDETRTLLADAVEHGWIPDVLVVDSGLYQRISDAKRAELAAGRPLTVLGLRLERAR
ncbi:hypothetical protein [Amycolatopsis pithecellobii]|uniref:Uncharacterized protein n=1 Tax=Amycolatopsis pithecellobii TaxID=664692 RepID=A0A6N7Z796_9PSEU|nr:hypothetical protein [Amycolatopsis pithecellobii]MTD57041.1 hypothetical protein [Amycolatopsis pithecellobii]